MKYEDELTQEELGKLTEDCKVNAVDKSSFQLMRERTTKEFISIIGEFSGLIHLSQGKACSVCRVSQGFDIPKLQDWLERLGETAVKGRSWSKVEVRVIKDFIVVTNTVRARGCLRRTHNENIMFNIDKILEDNYLKEKQDGRQEV